MERTLAVPELLELILSMVEARTLITSAQRVSRGWRSMAQNSPALQKRLCLLPSDDDDDDDDADGKEGELGVMAEGNLLLKRPFLSLWYTQPDRMNVLHHFKPGWSSTTTRDCETSKKLKKIKEAWLRPHASWRNMLTHSPPVYKLAWHMIHDPTGYNMRGSTTVAEFYFPDGLRAGSLYDMVIAGARPSMMAASFEWPKNCRTKRYGRRRGSRSAADGVKRPEVDAPRATESESNDDQKVNEGSSPAESNNNPRTRAPQPPSPKSPDQHSPDTAVIKMCLLWGHLYFNVRPHDLDADARWREDTELRGRSPPSGSHCPSCVTTNGSSPKDKCTSSRDLLGLERYLVALHHKANRATVEWEDKLGTNGRKAAMQFVELQARPWLFGNVDAGY